MVGNGHSQASLSQCQLCGVQQWVDHLRDLPGLVRDELHPLCDREGRRSSFARVDGHASHLSLTLIEKAREAQITLLKLPPKTTDMLQPLDVSCFFPVKKAWNTHLQNQISASAGMNHVDKKNFVDILTTVWRQGLSEENVKAGFEATGLFPPDRTKYKVERLSQRKLKMYNLWVAGGKNLNDEGEPDLPEDPDAPRPEPIEVHLEGQPDNGEDQDLEDLEDREDREDQEDQEDHEGHEDHEDHEDRDMPGTSAQALRRSPRKHKDSFTPPIQRNMKKLCTTPLGIYIPRDDSRRNSPSPSPVPARAGSAERARIIVPEPPTTAPPPGYEWCLTWTIRPTQANRFADAIMVSVRPHKPHFRVGSRV